jgi:hypothetical protein
VHWVPSHDGRVQFYSLHPMIAWWHQSRGDLNGDLVFIEKKTPSIRTPAGTVRVIYCVSKSALSRNRVLSDIYSLDPEGCARRGEIRQQDIAAARSFPRRRLIADKPLRPPLWIRKTAYARAPWTAYVRAPWTVCASFHYALNLRFTRLTSPRTSKNVCRGEEFSASPTVSG